MELKRSLYVDIVLTSFKDEDTLLSFYRKSSELLQKGGFNLRTWNSHNKNLMNLAPEDRVEDSSKNVNVLGMQWKVDNDKLSFHQPTHRVTQKLIKERY